MNWYKKADVVKDKTYGYQPLICPFCNEVDFDAIGLKKHLLSGNCNIFEKVPSIEEELQKIKEKIT